MVIARGRRVPGPRTVPQGLDAGTGPSNHPTKYNTQEGTALKVIKAVDIAGGKLVSTYAVGDWRKEYAIGVATTPDTGYLFAYPDTPEGRRQACNDMGGIARFFVAEAVVVGKISKHTSMREVPYRSRWSNFWKGFDLEAPDPEDEDTYLLCSSITLLEAAW